MISMIKNITYILLICGLLFACQDSDYLSESGTPKKYIEIDGVTISDELEVAVSDISTRANNQAVDAETQTWLIGPLKSGLDITYGKVGNTSTDKVAILKLLGGTPDNTEYDKDDISGWAKYSFKYREDGTDAIWYDNGAHYFEGVYVPDNIRYGSGTGDSERSELSSVNTTTAPNIISDQSEPEGNINYTLLERYLGMPANTRLSATVARVRLPFRHRLCRVLAYVLIDPSMGPDVILDGYMSDGTKDSPKEDPSTTKIRFCNVSVLSGVKDDKDANEHHTLTPQWTTQRKVVPHFCGEENSKNSLGEVVDENDFIVFYNINTETYIFPTNDKDWVAAKTKYETALAANDNNEANAEKACKIRRIKYGKVPVYGIIARPTYTTLENVMYDEAGVKKADGTEDDSKKNYYLNATNKIDFDIALSNDLQYTKEFQFDLDANYQTIVYLRISRESVDYNSSGSELWITDMRRDNWYGIDNELGHSLSIAGSSWQRAYTTYTNNYNYGVTNDSVTDGGYYNQSTIDEDGIDGQYLSDATWIKKFAQAYEGGAHHGDYFALKKDITMDASELPIGFVFTGHLDAQGHTITLTGTNSWAECTNEVFTLLRQTKSDEDLIPQLYYVNEIAQAPIRKTRSIEYGEPVAVDMAHTTPADLNPDLTYLCKNAEGKYEEYSNRKFYKRTAPALLYGLNGNYITPQEKASLAPNLWEANVHKEGNNWVPYRTDDSDFSKGQGSGWRAEILNLKLKGTLFTDDAIITGNVQNNYEGTSGNIKVRDHVPAIPKY